MNSQNSIIIKYYDKTLGSWSLLGKHSKILLLTHKDIDTLGITALILHNFI